LLRRGEKFMIEIKNLLVRFGDILLREEGKKEAVRKVISSVIKTEIKSEDVKIKNNVVYLNIKPIYKNEIFLKKEQILLALKESLCKKTPENIR
jgi:hypothetical protein